jgi:hypothetical protein
MTKVIVIARNTEVWLFIIVRPVCGVMSLSGFTSSHLPYEDLAAN